MKYLIFIVMSLFILTACSLSISDTPALRSAIDAKFGATPASSMPGMIRITLLTPPPMPTIEPQVDLPTVTPTPCALVIKGNINSAGVKIAHSPGQANYESTVIDESKGEKWFCTLEQAEASGWRAAQR